jgi:ribosomal protein L22
MGKRQRERDLGENEAKAVSKMLRISPQKLNLVAQLIRGKKVASALADLEFSRKRIAKDVRKCLNRRSRTPRTITISTSTISSSPRRMSARRS